MPNMLTFSRTNSFTYFLMGGLVLVSMAVKAQYTDIINSNSPGNSTGAFSVGTGIYQAETHFFVDRIRVDSLNSESIYNNSMLSLRVGLFKENLELTYDGSYSVAFFTSPIPGEKIGIETGVLLNRIGLKYLVYDPFKRSNGKTNVYSWNANNGFRWRNLIPAVSVYAGANIGLSSSPFMLEKPSASPRAMLVTQSNITPRFVLILNGIYDYIGDDVYGEKIFIASLSHALKAKWSLFVEGQYSIQNAYTEKLLRVGGAFLYKRNIQFDIFGGLNFEEAPKKVFAGLGFSYRIDNHKIK